MILPDQIAHAVAAGRVTVAYRRWARLRVSAGSTLRSVAGVIRIDRIDQIDANAIQDADATKAGYDTAAELVRTFRGKESDPVYRIALAWIGEDTRKDLARSARLTSNDIADISSALNRFDRHTPWAKTTLQLLRKQPGMRAVELASHTHLSKESMKRRIRQLKELGLTLSLQSGYELSPRGDAYLSAMVESDFDGTPEYKVDI